MSQILLFVAIFTTTAIIGLRAEVLPNMNTSILTNLTLIEKINKEICDENKPQLDVEALKRTFFLRLGQIIFTGNLMNDCEALKNNYAFLAQPVADAIENCTTLYTEMPDFVMGVVLNVTDSICYMPKENLIELMNPCITKVDFLSECLPFEKIMKGYVERKVLKKNQNMKLEICQLYKKHRGCLVVTFKEECTEEVTQETFFNILDAAFEKPC